MDEFILSYFLLLPNSPFGFSSFWWSRCNKACSGKGGQQGISLVCSLSDFASSMLRFAFFRHYKSPTTDCPLCILSRSFSRYLAVDRKSYKQVLCQIIVGSLGGFIGSNHYNSRYWQFRCFHSCK